MDKRHVGQEQIEAAIGIMVETRGLKLETPIHWLKHSDADIYTIEGRISGHNCVWNLIGEAVENYVSDLDVRHSVDFNLQTYFIPR